MTITLEKAALKDAHAIHALQIRSFLPILQKYKDEETNPASEPLDKTLERITNSSKGFYKILRHHTLVGAVAVKHIAPSTIFLGPLFVDPDYQNQKIAQKALRLIEVEFSDIIFFELSAICQEKNTIHLYEKMGYIATEQTKKLTDSLEVLFFKKALKGF